MHSLDGQLAIVTGAAGGIGRAAAEILAAHGARLLLVDRDMCRLDEVGEELRSSVVEALAVDVTDPADVETVVLATRRAGGPSVLVNCIGIQRRAPIEEVTVSDLEVLWRVNVVGVFGVTQALLPQFIERQQGKIINLCSIGSFIGLEFKTVYAMTKGAVAQYTRSLAVEVAKHGIQVNGIAPGYVDTPMTHDWLYSNPDNTEAFLSRIPLRRFATPGDIKGPVLFLASHASDYMTGQVLVLDGGWTIS